MLTFPKATVLGKYVYIDGGLIVQKVDGQVQPGHWPSDPMNSTLSIDISKSWSAETVEFKVTPKTNGPVSLANQAIWNHPDGNAFYTFGGRAFYGCNKEKITTDGIWKFAVDGQGGGSWAKEQPSNLDMFKTINLTYGAAYASTYGPSGGIGFSIGGYVDGNTDPKAAKYDKPLGFIPSMVAYDMKTKTVSTSDITMVVPPRGHLFQGRAQFVPQFGPNGLVFLLGGLAYSDAGNHGLDYGNISFFDPQSREWRWQSTRGNMPSHRFEHCMVGIASPAGTYEM